MLSFFLGKLQMGLKVKPSWTAATCWEVTTLNNHNSVISWLILIHEVPKQFMLKILQLLSFISCLKFAFASFKKVSKLKLMLRPLERIVQKLQMERVVTQLILHQLQHFWYQNNSHWNTYNCYFIHNVVIWGCWASNWPQSYKQCCSRWPT